MTLTLLSVTYRLRTPARDFRAHAEKAAVTIVKAPGLIWKIWGFNPETGRGTSVYLFRDSVSAEAFAAGPAIDGLRSGPAEEVATHVAPVDAGLSNMTGASAVLAFGETTCG